MTIARGASARRCDLMPARALVTALMITTLLLPAAMPSPAYAQNGREAQRKLEKINRELKSVAAERRKLEGQRGDASTQLRKVDEQVGSSARALRETEVQLASQRTAFAQLAERRDAMRITLASQRKELAGLLRAAYAVGDDAPLKVMLSQDSVAEANRALAYHRVLQHERTARIHTLTGELAELEHVEREITETRVRLTAASERQRGQVATLERDRRDRVKAVASLDQRYADRQSREQALGQDAKALKDLLAKLRVAAARAAAERRAAAAEAAREQASADRTPDAGGNPRVRPPPIAVARTAPIRVGGLGWPLSGSLLASYGGTLPDGRKSSGVLIGAPAGTTITAVADGTVVFSEWMTGYGMILIIDHGNGTMSLYAHNDALLKDAGAVVRRGDPVASVGSSGGQSVPGLYFELRRDGQPVDPRSWLQKQ